MTPGRPTGPPSGGLPRWVQDFQSSPGQALTDLVARTKYWGPIAMLDAYEVLEAFAAMSDEPDVVATTLDKAALEWVKPRWGSLAIEDRGAPIGTQWLEVLRSLAVVPVRFDETANYLRTRVQSAVDFLGPLGTGPATDPLDWYWALLARYQKDDQLVEHWWALCKLNPGSQPWHGMRGLEGLRWIPGSERGGFRVTVAEGLASYTAALFALSSRGKLRGEDARRYANMAAKALTRAYPFPDRWREWWWTANASVDPTPRSWLSAVLPEPRRQRSVLPRRLTFDYEWPPRAKRLAAAVRQGDPGARREAEELLRDQREYTVATGDAYGFVRTLCNIGSAAVGSDARWAIELAREAAQWEPWNAYTWTTATEAYLAAGEIASAASLAVDAVELFPDDPVARNGLGDVLKAAGRFEDAEAAYLQAIELFPDNPVARCGLGEVLKAAGRFKDAEAAYLQAIELFPDNPVARNGLGDVLKAAGRFEDAEAAYLQAIELFPDNVVARCGLGEVLKAAGRFEDAEAAYLQAIELFPDDPVARNGLTALQRHRASPPLIESLAPAQAATLPAAGLEDLLEPQKLAQALRYLAGSVLPNLRSRYLERALEELDRADVASGGLRQVVTRVAILLDSQQPLAALRYLDTLPESTRGGPALLALSSLAALAELRLRSGLRFTPEQVDAVTGPWERASRSTEVLEPATPLLQLSASLGLVDGQALQDLRSASARELSERLRVWRTREGDGMTGERLELGRWWAQVVSRSLDLNGEATDQEESSSTILGAIAQNDPLLRRMNLALVSAATAAG